MFKKKYYFKVAEYKDKHDISSITCYASGTYETMKLDYDEFMDEVCKKYSLDRDFVLLEALNKL